MVGRAGGSPSSGSLLSRQCLGTPRGKVAHMGRWGPRRWQWYHGAGPWGPWGPALACQAHVPRCSGLSRPPWWERGVRPPWALGIRGLSSPSEPPCWPVTRRKATGGRLGPSLELSSQIWGRAQVVSSKCPDPLTMVYHLRSLLVRAWLGAHRYGSCRPGLGAEWGSGKGVGSKSSRHGGVRILAPPPVTSSRQDASSETPSQPVSFRSQSLWQPVSVCARHLPLPLHLQLQDRGTVAPAT